MGDSSIFSVTAHHALPDRGGFVLGTACGEVRPGMSVRGVGSCRVFAVSGVESLSGEGRHSHALVFRGKPAIAEIAEIAEAFLIGSAVFSVGIGPSDAL